MKLQRIDHKSSCWITNIQIYIKEQNITKVANSLGWEGGKYEISFPPFTFIPAVENEIGCKDCDA